MVKQNLFGGNLPSTVKLSTSNVSIDQFLNILEKINGHFFTKCASFYVHANRRALDQYFRLDLPCTMQTLGFHIRFFSFLF